MDYLKEKKKNENMIRLQDWKHVEFMFALVDLICLNKGSLLHIRIS
jgi:hypothetical protein